MSDTPRTDALLQQTLLLTNGEALRIFEEEFEQLERELAQAKKDAERYRWLRDSDNAYPLFFIAQRDPNNIVVQFRGDLADANIDAMMQAQGKEEG